MAAFQVAFTFSGLDMLGVAGLNRFPLDPGVLQFGLYGFLLAPFLFVRFLYPLGRVTSRCISL